MGAGRGGGECLSPQGLPPQETWDNALRAKGEVAAGRALPITLIRGTEKHIHWHWRPILVNWYKATPTARGARILAFDTTTATGTSAL
jgi:hypothetical protein